MASFGTYQTMQVWQATVNDIEEAYILYFYPVEFHVKVKSSYLGNR